MNTERSQQVLDLFDQALEHDPGQRTPFLEDACEDSELRHEVESLLAADAEFDPRFEQPIVSLRPEPPEPNHVGRTIGHYKLLEEIGRGGLGVVYLAAREDHEFEHEVALKLIKRGMDTDEVVHRFRNERRILAKLQHPNIARLFDGGSTDDGLPYFVMERVKGERLDRYCDDRELFITARLRLFLEVCSAVHYAHQRLVVHRDLKPGNILVTGDGPKLLDFGIAKLLSSDGAPDATLTVQGSSPLTFGYASPEQLLGATVTTASDIYSLGVILYQLLAGHLPSSDSSKPLEDVRRLWEEPERPSTAVRRREEISTAGGTTVITPDSVSVARGTNPRKLRRRLAGDLDSIVLKALHKKPENRYGSVEQLAEDIRRHLAGLPVQAREGTFAYRTGKFVRRNRWRLAAAFVLLSVAAAGVRGLNRAEVAKNIAEGLAEGAHAQATIWSDFLRNLLTISNSEEKFTIHEILANGERRIRDNLEGEQLATQLEILGKFYLDQSLREKARELLEEALRIQRGLHEGDHPLIARLLNNLAAWHYGADEYEQAEELYREALGMRRRLGHEGVDLVKPMSNLASILMNRGDFAEAEDLYERALAIRKSAFKPDDRDVATSLRSLGVFLYVRGDFERAENLLGEALEIRRQRFGARSREVAAVQSTLGRVLHARGKLSAAETVLAEVLDSRRQRLGEGHLHTALTKKDLAAVFLDQGKPADAEALLTPALRIVRAEKPEGSWEIADAESLWGAILVESGRYEEAEPLLTASYLSLEDLRGAEAIYTRNARRRLVELYEAWGRQLPAWLKASSRAAADDGA